MYGKIRLSLLAGLFTVFSALAADGQVTSETLLRQPEGIIRDPCVSFAGTQIVFSMRASEHADDYHLYVLRWPDRSVQPSA